MMRTVDGVEIKPVEGFPWSFISATGRVFSTLRAGNQKASGRTGDLHEISSAAKGSHGYRSVRLRSAGGTYRTMNIHVLVAEAFLGPRPAWGKHVRHLDGDRKNCSASNLAWGTVSDNIADSISHGTHVCGSDVKNSVLTEEKVLEIRKRRRSGERQKGLAKEFGVAQSIVSRVCARKIWRHVA